MEPRQRDLLTPAVWAPVASAVDLVIGENRYPMRQISDQDGWWEANSQLKPGDLYRFSLDGGPAMPDPRSLFQPNGVHGPSAIVDPELLTTGRVPWNGIELTGMVLYEMHPGTFTAEGTFDAAIKRIGHLKDIGVQAVEVMPVAPIPGGRGWGYDGVGLYAVNASYGGPEQFVHFIDACHEAGLGVILDVVHNHLGPEGNYLGAFGPYFTTRHSTPWGDAINLDDQGSVQVRRFLMDSVAQWVELFGIDGLRLDAVHELRDDSKTHFLADLSVAVTEMEDRQGRPVALIAEADLNQPYMVSPVGSVEHARGMHAQWADDVHHAIHSFVTGESAGYYYDFRSIDALQKALTHVFVHDGIYSTFRNMEWGAPVDPDVELYTGHSFVVFMQNHDQVGNRPAGDRITRDAHPGIVAGGAALYLLSAFTPMLFMGEEWAASTPFPFFSDLGPELGPLVSQGRRQEFEKMEWDEQVPDPQAEQTWRSAVLRWDEMNQGLHARMLDWYRRVLALRHSEEEVRDGDLRSVSASVIDDDTIVMKRGSIHVAVTRATTGATLPISSDAQVLLSWDTPEVRDGCLHLIGPGAVIVRVPS